MKAWKITKKILQNACVYFTVFSLLIILIKLLMDGTDNAGTIYTVSFLLFFPFGICMALGQELLRAQAIHRAVRYLAHYAITVLSIYIFLWLPSNVSAGGATVLLLLVLLTVLYWILFGLVVLVRSRIKKLMEED